MNYGAMSLQHHLNIYITTKAFLEGILGTTCPTFCLKQECHQRQNRSVVALYLRPENLYWQKYHLIWDDQ